MPDASHYSVQKERRDTFITDWRRHRQTVVQGADGVPLDVVGGAPGQRSTGYLGLAAGRPTRFLDATAHDFVAGTSTSPAAQSWDAVCFVVDGEGSVVVDGESHSFRAWDAFHLPGFRSHHCEFTAPTRLLTFSSYPAVDLLGAARQFSSAPDQHSDGGAFVPPALVQRLNEGLSAARSARVHTDYDSEELRLNPKGTRSKFLVDPSLGYETSGLTMVMTQYAPGRGQAMHAHPGEAYLYVVEGEGESYIGSESEGGTWYPWRSGDLVVVDHFVWHQHRNTSPDKPARLLRVHMMETMLATMRAVMDPIELLLEPQEMFDRMPPVSADEWPGDERPA